MAELIAWISDTCCWQKENPRKLGPIPCGGNEISVYGIKAEYLWQYRSCYNRCSSHWRDKELQEAKAEHSSFGGQA